MNFVQDAESWWGQMRHGDNPTCEKYQDFGSAAVVSEGLVVKRKWSCVCSKRQFDNWWGAMKKFSSFVILMLNPNSFFLPYSYQKQGCRNSRDENSRPTKLIDTTSVNMAQGNSRLPFHATFNCWKSLKSSNWQKRHLLNHF